MIKRNGIRYSEQQRASIIKRMMPPYNEPVAKVAKEEGISSQTPHCTSGVRRHVQLVKQHQETEKPVTNGVVKISF